MKSNASYEDLEQHNSDTGRTDVTSERAHINHEREREWEGHGAKYHIRVYHLWAMGVGAVISGDIYGWQSCLEAGFLGACICLVIVTIMYILLGMTVAELASFRPDAGGPYTYVTALLGESLGFMTGLAETLKVVTVCSVILFAIGAYMVDITDSDPKWQPLWWLFFAILFTLLNVVGVKLSFAIQFAFTVLTLIVMAVFYIGAIPKFDFNKWVLGECDDNTDNSSSCPEKWLFPNGLDGLSAGLSFSLWFYLGVEEIPLVVGEHPQASSVIPAGMFSTIGTLMAVAFCTVLFSSSIEPGAQQISIDNSPLLTGYKTIFNHAHWFDYMCWVIVVGFIASCQSFLFCTGQLVYAMSRDQLFPQFLSRVHSRLGSPYIALITSAVVSYVILGVLYCIVENHDDAGSVLINMCLIGSLISYLIQCSSHLYLYWKYPDRTCYRSPFGIAGSIITMILCLIIYACIIKQGVKSIIYLYSVIAGLIFLGGGMFYHYAKVFWRRRSKSESRDTLIGGQEGKNEDT